MREGKIIRYKIVFLDYWHIGSGVSGGAKFDSSVLKGEDGVPYIPGRTLKGLFREIAEEIKSTLEEKEQEKYQKRIIDTYFGAFEKERGEGWEGGKAYFSDAVVEEREKIGNYREHLYDYIAGTQLENGIAVDHSLREVEVVVPLTLIGEVRGIEKQDKEEIERILIGLTRLGLKRHRGFGRCRIEIVPEEKKEQNKKGKKEIIPQKEKKMGGSPSIPFLPLPPEEAKGENHKRALFWVALKSKVVIRGSTNTEGKILFLDFIPGSAVAGIVAQQFERFEDPIKIFYSNQVKFGDGLPLHPKKPSVVGIRPPLSYFTPKKEKEKGVTKFYNLVRYSWKDEKKIIDKKGQLVQQRGGYLGVGEEGYYLFQLPLNYIQKSAYDRRRRRAKDEALFGYRSLPAGVQFIVPVEFGPEIDKEEQKKIEKILEGVHRIGKSKSAEYGLVEIEKIGESPKYLSPLKKRISQFEKDGKFKNVPIYFLSRVALIDGNFQETLDPRWLLGPDEELKMDYSKCNLQFYTYFPFNQIRKYWDRERIVIERGSVVVLKEATLEQLERIERGVGLYQNQGFGVVIVNPPWLAEEEVKVEEEECCRGGKKGKIGEKIGDREGKSIYKEALLINWLEGEKVYKENLQKLVEEVHRLVPEFQRSGLSISQWGRIRAIARGVNREILEELKKYLFSREKTPRISKEDWNELEKSLKKWNKKGRGWGKKFVELLALEIQKRLKREKMVQKGEKDG